jgi:DNA-binding response OmpR family regulator
MSQAKISVLLIEDDLEDAELIQRSFKSVSPDVFDVLHVSRFRDAIQAIKKTKFHVTIMDLGLPDSVGLNGVERLMSLIPQVPVIVLTGSDDEDQAIKGIELGAQEFIRKGDIDSKQLIRTIRHAIKRMQYAMRLVGEGLDDMQTKRLEDLGETVRKASDEIGKNVQSLGETELTEAQTTLVADIKKSSEESLNAVERLIPNEIDFVESYSSSDDDKSP